MVQSRTVEIWVGIFVAAGLAALFVLAMRVSNLSTFTTEDGYQLVARFENVSGLKERSPVTMAGVRIGRVAEISFDPQTYEAVVSMEIGQSFEQIPEDSVAGIYTSGLLGEKYIGIQAGVADDFLAGGDRIRGGQSSLVLEELIGKFLFNRADDGGSGGL